MKTKTMETQNYDDFQNAPQTGEPSLSTVPLESAAEFLNKYLKQGIPTDRLHIDETLKSVFKSWKQLSYDECLERERADRKE
jgi:hypothetical protein